MSNNTDSRALRAATMVNRELARAGEEKRIPDTASAIAAEYAPTLAALERAREALKILHWRVPGEDTDVGMLRHNPEACEECAAIAAIDALGR